MIAQKQLDICLFLTRRVLITQLFIFYEYHSYSSGHKKYLHSIVSIVTFT